MRSIGSSSLATTIRSVRAAAVRAAVASPDIAANLPGSRRRPQSRGSYTPTVRTVLLLYTDRAVRRVLEHDRPGRLVFASDDVTPEDRRVYDTVVPLPPVWEIEATLDVLRTIEA